MACSGERELVHVATTADGDAGPPDEEAGACDCEICKAGGDCCGEPIATSIGDLLGKVYDLGLTPGMVAPRNRDVIQRAAREVLEAYRFDDLVVLSRADFFEVPMRVDTETMGDKLSVLSGRVSPWETENGCADDV